MAKLLLVCARDPRATPALAARAAAVARRLTPDNLTNPRPPLVHEGEGVVVAVSSPVPASRVVGGHVHVGYVSGDTAWEQVGGPVPDGTFAAVRWDDEQVEVLTDPVASRTVWYVHDDEVFAASTSQRLLAAALDDLQFNLAPVPWLLTTGFMGPGLAWDVRVRMLPGDSRLSLDRRSWALRATIPTVAFEPAPGSDEEHRERLDATLREALSTADLDPDDWVLPLSGGFDSRSLLCLLPERERLRTLTWGDPSTFDEPKGDVAVARDLASTMGVAHTTLSTGVTDESVDVVFDRFVACGEGRCVRLSAYADGFAMWRDLAADGVHGIIRGDEGFGCTPVTRPADVRRYEKLTMWDEYGGLPPLTQLGLEEQVMPAELEQRPEETLEAWRDRVSHVHELPVALAALSDLKLPYVEVVNPLLTRSLIHLARTMPDHLRSGKAGFKDVVRNLGPDVPFARFPAIADDRDLVRNAEATRVLRAELTSDAARDLLPPELLEHLTAGLRESQSSGSLRRRFALRVVGRLPQVAESTLRRTVAPQSIHPNVLGFRALVASRTGRLLRADHAAARAAAPLPRP